MQRCPERGNSPRPRPRRLRTAPQHRASEAGAVEPRSRERGARAPYLGRLPGLPPDALPRLARTLGGADRARASAGLRDPASFNRVHRPQLDASRSTRSPPFYGDDALVGARDSHGLGPRARGNDGFAARLRLDEVLARRRRRGRPDSDLRRRGESRPERAGDFAGASSAATELPGLARRRSNVRRRRPPRLVVLRRLTTDNACAQRCVPTATCRRRPTTAPAWPTAPRAGRSARRSRADLVRDPRLVGAARERVREPQSAHSAITAHGARRRRPAARRRRSRGSRRSARAAGSKVSATTPVGISNRNTAASIAVPMSTS